MVKEGFTEKKLVEVLKKHSVPNYMQLVSELRRRAEKEGTSDYTIKGSVLYGVLLGYMSPSTAAAVLRELLPQTWSQIVSAAAARRVRIR